MRQGIIFGIVLIVLSIIGVRALEDILYTDDADIKLLDISVGGEELYSSPLDDYSTKIIWYIKEDDGTQLILEDEEINEYYDFGVEMSKLSNPDFIDYDKISSISGENTEFNMILVKQGEVGVYEANCPNKECVKTGTISKVNQSIVCIPHKFIASIEGYGDLDA